MSETLFSLLSTVSEGLLRKIGERFGVGTIVRVVVHILLAYIVASLIVTYCNPRFEVPLLVWYILKLVSLPLALLLLTLSIFFEHSRFPTLFSGEIVRDSLVKTMGELVEGGMVDEEKALEIVGKLYADKIKQLRKFVVLLIFSYWLSLINIMIFIHRFYWEFLSLSIAKNYVCPLLLSIIVVTLAVARYRHILPDQAIALACGLLAWESSPEKSETKNNSFKRCKLLIIEFVSLFMPLVISSAGKKVEGPQTLFLAVIPNSIECYGSPSKNRNQICKIVNNTEKNRVRWFSEFIFKNTLKTMLGREANLAFVTPEYINIFFDFLKKNIEYSVVEIECSKVIGEYISAESLLSCLVRSSLESLKNSYVSIDEFIAISKVVIDVLIPVEFPTTRHKDRVPDSFSHRLCFCKFLANNKPTSLYVIMSWGDAVKKVNGAGLATAIKLSKWQESSQT